MMELQKIEADVVIVVSHCDGMGEVHPLWECEKTDAELQTLGAMLSLALSEKMGGGFASWNVIDHRETV